MNKGGLFWIVVSATHNPKSDDLIHCPLMRAVDGIMHSEKGFNDETISRKRQKG